MPRQARLDGPGTLHRVMIRVIDKRRNVDDDHDRREAVRRMCPPDKSPPMRTWQQRTVIN